MNIEILVREIRYKIDKKKRDKKESRAYKNSPKKKTANCQRVCLPFVSLRTTVPLPLEEDQAAENASAQRQIRKTKQKKKKTESVPYRSSSF